MYNNSSRKSVIHVNSHKDKDKDKDGNNNNNSINIGRIIFINDQQSDVYFGAFIIIRSLYCIYMYVYMYIIIYICVDDDKNVKHSKVLKSPKH